MSSRIVARQHHGRCGRTVRLLQLRYEQRGDMAELRIGGMRLQREAAFEQARHYLTVGRGWAYPSYDGYDAAHARGPLTDADLLAPVLLNVRQMSITTYEQLQNALPRLQELLDLIPERESLADAGAAEFELLGELFGVVDNSAIRGARGTVISKILHRKRPGFIPLYDPRVGAVYQGGPEAPIPVVKASAVARIHATVRCRRPNRSATRGRVLAGGCCTRAWTSHHTATSLRHRRLVC